jgi:hypothetical protein
MDGFLHVRQSSRSLGALFGEDFDRPEATPEPEVIEPTFSAAELANAGEAAWRDGHAAAKLEAADADTAAIRQALGAIAEAFTAERDAAAARQEQSAEAIARLLLDSLAALFPTLCARYGEAEMRAVIRVVLPALAQEPAVTVRTHQRTAAALAQELSRLDPEIAARVRAIECDAMPPGDVRITWRNGSATRDASAIWQEVAAVLVPAGLLSADAAIKETTNGG